MRFKQAGILGVSGLICFFSAVAAAEDDKRWPVTAHLSREAVRAEYLGMALILGLMLVGVILCCTALVFLGQSLYAVTKRRKATGTL